MRARFLVLLPTLVALHATIDAPPVFAQPPPAPTLTSATSDGTLVILQWTLLADSRLRYRVEAGSAPGRSDLAVIDAGSHVAEYRAYRARGHLLRARAVGARRYGQRPLERTGPDCGGLPRRVATAVALALPHYRHVVLAPPDMCATLLPAPAAAYPAFALAAGRHHATINSGNAARYDLAAVTAYCRALDDALRRGPVEGDTLYVLNREYRAVFASKASIPLACGTIDGYAVCVTAASYVRWRDAAAQAGVSLAP